MRQERNDRERLFDDAVLLYLWAGAAAKSPDGEAGDKLKLTKLAFLVTDDLFWHGIKALNLKFYKYTWGPYAKEINTNWEDLRVSRHLVEEERFRVTEQGQRLADAFGNEVLGLPENRLIRSTLDDVIERFGGWDTDALLRHVYGMRCHTLESPGGRHKIESIKKYTDLTGILEDDEARESLVVEPGWEMTLELAMHPDALMNLQRAIEDTHSGRVYGMEALFSNV